MSSPHPHRATRALCAIAATALALALTGSPEPVSASAAGHSIASVPAGTWTWPVPGAHDVLRPYAAPATRYSAGHRGIDVRSATGTAVAAPESGTIRFAGVVVDRSTITIETSSGVLISMEPVVSTLAVGEVVERGAIVGRVSTGGHCDSTCLHLSVRVNGDYASPLAFFGGVPRAVLLPVR
jgi:murein DD-endopeptidase MepM/ murein hydrolase activator NlpD